MECCGCFQTKHSPARNPKNKGKPIKKPHNNEQNANKVNNSRPLDSKKPMTSLCYYPQDANET